MRQKKEREKDIEQSRVGEWIVWHAAHFQFNSVEKRLFAATVFPVLQNTPMLFDVNLECFCVLTLLTMKHSMNGLKKYKKPYCMNWILPPLLFMAALLLKFLICLHHQISRISWFSFSLCHVLERYVPQNEIHYIDKSHSYRNEKESSKQVSLWRLVFQSLLC